MLEAVKLSCILNPVGPCFSLSRSPMYHTATLEPSLFPLQLTTEEYRKWVTPREVLRMAAEGGAAAINMTGKAGRVEAGYVADLVLYDLTALSLLPRTDPVGLLVMGRPRSVTKDP